MILSFCCLVFTEEVLARLTVSNHAVDTWRCGFYSIFENVVDSSCRKRIYNNADYLIFIKRYNEYCIYMDLDDQLHGGLLAGVESYAGSLLEDLEKTLGVHMI